MAKNGGGPTGFWDASKTSCFTVFFLRPKMMLFALNLLFFSKKMHLVEIKCEVAVHIAIFCDFDCVFDVFRVLKNIVFYRCF